MEARLSESLGLPSPNLNPCHLTNDFNSFVTYFSDRTSAQIPTVKKPLTKFKSSRKQSPPFASASLSDPDSKPGFLKWLKPASRSSPKIQTLMKHLSVFERALIGAGGGGIAGAFTYVCLLPLDTIKTKLQAKGASQVYSSSFRSSQKIEDAFRKMKVDNENGESDAYPDRPGERDCQFYLRTGLCGYGSTCRFNHPTNLPQGIYYSEELPERIGQPDCEYYLKTGACKYGSTCKYHHPKDRNGAEPVLFNVLNLPMRQGEKPCQYYLRTGTCRFGVACKFHHPQPDNGHSTAPYGMSTFPSAGLTHAGGLTMMPAYGNLPRPQLHQSYVPVIVSPSQGPLPPQSWATYMGASNSMYGVKNQVYYSGTSAPMPMAVTLNGDLSERSEQQEQCRFFMNTGTCKYGDHCKYTHLGVRVSPPPAPPNFINPFVLPMRPGQPACGSFKSYGFCKFGPNCNFDHSMLPYPTGLPIPSSSLPTPYGSHVSSNYQRISPSPSRSVSKAIHNDKPDVKKEMSGTEKLEQEQDLSENLSSPRS